MDNEKIKDKISKLLKLSVNPNENEAKQALLKARQLMAKYKITESNVASDNNSKVVEALTNISFTKTTGIWVPYLSEAICKNYCCVSSSIRDFGKRTYKLNIIGLSDDVEVAKSVLQYAYDFVKNRCSEIKEEHKDYNVSAYYIRNLCSNYGIGFALGVDRMFNEQNKVTETGIVLVTPTEVYEYIKGMTTRDFDAVEHLERNEGSEYYKIKGYADGKQFKPNKSLK